MTRCLNLVAIVAIATTTFLSTFAHGLNVELTDKGGVIHKFQVDDGVCKEIPGGIIAVSGKTNAETCYLYKTSSCGTVYEDHRAFSGGAGAQAETFKEYTANSIVCDDFHAVQEY